MSEKPYSAAIVSFLDRGPQTETVKMCYPITRIELLPPLTADNPEGLPRRVFVVDAQGQWQEQKP